MYRLEYVIFRLKPNKKVSVFSIVRFIIFLLITGYFSLIFSVEDSLSEIMNLSLVFYALFTPKYDNVFWLYGATSFFLIIYHPISEFIRKKVGETDMDHYIWKIVWKIGDNLPVKSNFSLILRLMLLFLSCISMVHITEKILINSNGKFKLFKFIFWGIIMPFINSFLHTIFGVTCYFLIFLVCLILTVFLIIKFFEFVITYITPI